MVLVRHLTLIFLWEESSGNQNINFLFELASYWAVSSLRISKILIYARLSFQLYLLVITKDLKEALIYALHAYNDDMLV